MSELDKLEAYLKEHGYEYTREDVDGEPYTDVHQIVVYRNGQRLWDAICHSGSYGYSQGLLEVMGEIADIATDPGACIGWLTAQAVIDMLEGEDG